MTIELQPQGKFGDYRLLELISYGGIAAIWHVTDRQGKDYALRVLHDSFGNNSAGPEMFRRGCDVMASLPPHPHIIRYHSHGTHEKRDYMLLEYIEGANLRQMTIKHDPLIEEKLSDIILELAEAVAHLHTNDWMHLDIKPENLVISRSGILKLCDFDTTLPIPSSPTKLPKKSGTPLYMPPEIVNGWGTDQRADIYSFGVTVYELVTRLKPFEGDSPAEMLRNQLDSRYHIRRPRELNPGVPMGLENLIIKCLAHLPEKRYAFMAHVLRDLHKALGAR